MCCHSAANAMGHGLPCLTIPNSIIFRLAQFICQHPSTNHTVTRFDQNSGLYISGSIGNDFLGDVETYCGH